MDTQPFGGPLADWNFSDISIDSSATMDIDSTGGQPPSLGDFRKIVVSEHSGSYQMCSDGQPPSVKDLCRREPSQSEASCNRYEGPDSHEVQQPRISEIGVENNCSVNRDVWQACAGPLVNLPAAGTHVVYFPQGHCEQVAASINEDVGAQNIPNYPNLPSKLLCILHNVTLHADFETDEVCAQMTLQPVTSFDKEAFLRSDLLTNAHKPQTEAFCKTLTASDTSTHGGFSVPRQAAEKIFPPLDYSMQRPAQKLVAKDLHGNVWSFCHIYRAQPKRHLLTTGWSLFVSRKKLFPGDSVLFIRDKNQDLVLGIRRANRQPVNLSSSVLSSDSMHIRILADAAHAVANNSPFTIFYNPR